MKGYLITINFKMVLLKLFILIKPIKKKKKEKENFIIM